MLALATNAHVQGPMLKDEFPDVKVMKTWWTNNDSIVRKCPICWPMHGVTIPVDENFQTIVGELDGPVGHVGCRCWRSTTTQITKDKGK